MNSKSQPSSEDKKDKKFIPHILIIFSHPLIWPSGQPVEVLDSKHERDILLRELRESNRSIKVRFDLANADSLTRGLAQGANILHFSGHGSPKFIVFEDGKGVAQLLDIDTFARLIESLGGIKLAFISSCHSGILGEGLIRANVPHVVAVKTEHAVLDYSATVFAREFYRFLINGRSVRDAYDIARAALRADPNYTKMPREAEKFLLLPEDASHDECVFAEAPAGPLIDLSSSLALSNLSVRRENFTGRALDICKVVNSLLNHRFVTLVGAPGIGKSEIAIETARWCHFRNLFPDGVLLVRLESASSPEVLREQISVSLKIETKDYKELSYALSPRKVLILMDNAEDILISDPDGFRSKLELILRSCPEVKFLSTSRERIGPGLSAVEQVIAVDSLIEPEARKLFYCAAPRPLTVSEMRSKALTEILHVLDGHPLSILLTAGQLTSDTSLDELLDHVSKRWPSIIEDSSTPSQAKGRTSSLQAAIASSYDPLKRKYPKAARMFRVLSLLPAGIADNNLRKFFDYDCSSDMSLLVKKSLVAKTDQRYRLLSPLRMYASKLLRPREKSVYAPKIVDLSLYLAHKFEQELGGEEAPTARESFAIEEQNIRAALHLAHQYRSTPEEISKQAILTYYLVRIYMFSDRCADAIAIADTVLETTPLPKDSGDRAHILLARGVARRRIGDLNGAETDIQNALVTLEKIDDKDSKDSMAICFTELSHLKMALEDFDSALWYSEAARIIFEEVGSSLGQANAILQRAQGKWFKDDLPGAETDYRTALNIYRAENDLRGQANVLVALADLILVTDKFETAEPELDAALSIYRKLGETLGEVHILCLRADLRNLQNRPDRSKEDWDAAITICDNIGYRLGKAHALLDRGRARLRYGEPGGITDLVDCIKLYDKSEQAGKRVESRLHLAAALASQGMKDEALEVLSEAHGISIELDRQPLIIECERLISEITR